MSLNKLKSGKYELSLYLKIGGRIRTVTYADKRAAKKFEENISTLDACLVTGERPDRELTIWLENLPTNMKKKLVKHRLLSQSQLEKSRTIKSHLRDFIQYQNDQATKGKLQPRQVNLLNTRLDRMIKDCNFKYARDISGNKVDSWMTNMYQTKLSAKSCNHYLQAMKQFCKWLTDNNRLQENTVKTLKPIRLNSENTEQRRALTENEITRLIITTMRSKKKHNKLTGLERSLVYRLALETGLRHNEIRTLKRGDFDLINMSVTVRDVNSKNSKTDTLPLRPELATALQDYFRDTPALPSAQAFINMQPKTGASMLRRDLEQAEIEYENEDGTADFHALRHTFCSLLARSGVQPQTAQRLMRHSDINLTMKHYTHILLDDKRMAVSALPKINFSREIKEATGTEDVANLGRFQSMSDINDSAYILPNSATSTDISKAEFRQIEKPEKSQIANKNTSNTGKNPIKTRVNGTLNTIDPSDTNWWARRDLNPYEKKSQGILNPLRLPIPPLARYFNNF